jgi:hypothetical protein
MKTETDVYDICLWQVPVTLEIVKVKHSLHPTLLTTHTHHHLLLPSTAQAELIFLFSTCWICTPSLLFYATVIVGG